MILHSASMLLKMANAHCVGTVNNLSDPKTMSNKVLLYELVCQHNEVSNYLKIAKEKERKLRDKIIQLAFTNPKIGTNRLSIADVGIELKGVVKETYSIDESQLEEVVDVGNGEWYNYPKPKPVLVMKEYNKLSDAEKAELAKCVTCKPSAPVLEYEGKISIPLGLVSIGGQLYLNGSLVNPDAAEKWCDFFGFTNSLELIKFLEQLA